MATGGVGRLRGKIALRDSCSRGSLRAGPSPRGLWLIDLPVPPRSSLRHPSSYTSGAFLTSVMGGLKAGELVAYAIGKKSAAASGVADFSSSFTVPPPGVCGGPVPSFGLACLAAVSACRAWERRCSRALETRSASAAAEGGLDGFAAGG